MKIPAVFLLFATSSLISKSESRILPWWPHEKPGTCPDSHQNVMKKNEELRCMPLCDDKGNCFIRCPFPIDPIPRCIHDSDCRGDLKCCSDGRYRRCRKPKHSKKPGICPKFRSVKIEEEANLHCELLCKNDKNCIKRCSIFGCRHDGECLGDKKCCAVGFSNRCMKPINPAKPGICPPIAFEHVLKVPCLPVCKEDGICLHHCNPDDHLGCFSDHECPGDLKCCFDLRYRRCKKPIKFNFPIDHKKGHKME